MAYQQQLARWSAGNPQTSTWTGGQLGIDSLHLRERPILRGSAGPDWTATPEGILLHVGRLLDPYAASNARSVCQAWRRAFSLHVRTARLEIVEHRAAQARAFMKAFMRAFPYTTDLVLDVTFRRTAREKIQAALEEHFQALHDFGVQALQLNLDLNSFNERKIKLPDVSLLASWSGLTRLTLQESGWRSQQLRVDPGSVFGALPCLQELSVLCKYSGGVKAKWWRPPSSAERLAARIPTWPPGAAGGGGGGADGSSGGAHGTGAGGRGSRSGGATGGEIAVRVEAGADAAMEDVEDVISSINNHPHPQQSQFQQHYNPYGAATVGSSAVASSIPMPPHAPAPAPAPAPPTPPVPSRPVLTQHLRCQMTQNQSMSGELAKALRRITPVLQPHVTALTFEIVEETYAEPFRCTTPLELSGLPGLKSLALLSGAEDALAHSRLEIVGASTLESLVISDVACGCWCYKKPGHGIPPRLLSAPPACLRRLTVVGFVVHQCQNLHALASLTCLEELRLEQPDPDSLAAVAGELALSWLPPSLRVLKLHSIVLPAWGGVNGSSGDGGAAAAEPPPPLPLAPMLPSVAEPVAAAGDGVAPSAPLPLLRDLYLSKCKVPTLGVLGVCPHLTALGLINCLSSSGMLPVPASMPALRSLALIHTTPAEQELLGPEAGCVGNRGAAVMGAGPPGGGMMTPPGMPYGAGPGAVRSGPGSAAVAGAPPYGGTAGRLPAAAAEPSPALPRAVAVAPHGPLPVPGLPLPPVVWGSDEQVAAVAACRSITSLELILPRGTAGAPAVAALARGMTSLEELDVCLPCGLSECMMGLAPLGGRRGGAGAGAVGEEGAGGSGRLRRLTLWVDGRMCVNRNRSRQLQAIQRTLQAHMPYTLVEWAGSESRHSSWTGLEARVFYPH